MKFFRAYFADELKKIPTYFIESTARDNVDDGKGDQHGSPPDLTPIENSDAAVQQIANILHKGSNPNLVVMVHGFNNPEPEVMVTYKAAALAIDGDAHIHGGDGLVCVGYRWPSEKMGTPWRATWGAMPTLPTWIFYAGVAFSIVPFLLLYSAPDSSRWLVDIFWLARHPLLVHIATMFGLTLAGLVLTAAVLRAIVYFRDNYRASNYGVPDLVQVIRAIDGELGKLRGAEPKNDVQLSFIGHSMGGFVVTNTLRVLTDVFSRPVSGLNSYGADPYPDDEFDPRLGCIGKAFVLKRFVLASPDIPAETLLSSRGNFLASVLSRFEEAYLFSSEGDEVLRQISTLANYFVFPTKSSNHGFRLGNVEILSSGYGLIGLKPAEDFLSMLRIGNLTVRQLHDTLARARVKAVSEEQAEPARPRTPLPMIFTYFDCTDYVEPESAKPGKQDKRPVGLLTFAKKSKAKNPKATLGWYSHLYLLFAYLRWQKPNVHGGYFEGQFSQELLYRLACLGYDRTIATYGSEADLGKACETKQIRALISPVLQARRSGMPTAAVQPARVNAVSAS
jgi:pimeloyl-ACP methyl ester carboxylesterase